MTAENKKILVAYFSHAGQNYSNGKLVDLEKGNTAVAAEIIAAETSADLFEIKTVHEYPNEYRACVSVAKEELETNLRPELSGDVDLSDYQVIVLGYPNWCGTMPMPVWTFLDDHNFEGKEILPFCTNEGSGMGRSESDLAKLAESARVKGGLALHGSRVMESRDAIQKWLKENNI